MTTQVAIPKIADRVSLRESQTRGLGTQLIPLTDYYSGSSAVSTRPQYWNRSSYDAQPYLNQLAEYEKFKMSVLEKKSGSELQDIIKHTGLVSAARDHYISTASTQISLTSDNENIELLYENLFKKSNWKQIQSQIFETLFIRGGAVVEMKFQQAGGMFLPIDLVVNDPKRFDFEEQNDMRVINGRKWALGLTRQQYFGQEFRQLENPAIAYIAWRPEVGEKPFGRSRVSPTAYYACTLIQTVRLVTKILSTSGSPVLPITIDRSKLYHGENNQRPLVDGDIDAYIKRTAADLRKTIPQLGEGDALILAGECVLGDYLTPASKINMQFLNEWKNELELDLLWAMGVPPAVLGIVQKSAALNDNNTRYLIKEFKEGCHNDQMLVADGLQPVFGYGARVNGLRGDLDMSFFYANIEAHDEMLDVQTKRMAALKTYGEYLAGLITAGVITTDEARERLDTEEARLMEF